jgi:hypothetical protein
VVPNVHRRSETDELVILYQRAPLSVISPFLVYRKSSDYHEKRPEVDQVERSNQTLKLTDQYLALLVLVFTNAGLCDVRLIMCYYFRDI